MPDQRTIPQAISLEQIGGCQVHTHPSSDWWLGCPETNPMGPTRTMSLAFDEPEHRPCEMTVVYLSHPHVVNYGLGTIATRFPDELSGDTLQLFGFGLSSLRSPTLIRRLLGAYMPEASLTAMHVPAFAREPLEPSAGAALRELSHWTGGTPEVLARLLGASRRSIYNWLKGKPLRGEFAARAMRLRTVLAPLGAEWHPAALVGWLQSGSPAPGMLARSENWVQLEEQVRLELLALQPQPEPERSSAHPATAEPLSSAALLAALEEFASPPPVPARVKTGWRPRELTGSTPGPDEE
jgi:hypothetical protein